jgi:hypothetical protein
VFNQAQIMALKKELFEAKENVDLLFKVVQDFIKSMKPLEIWFN